MKIWTISWIPVAPSLPSKQAHSCSRSWISTPFSSLISGFNLCSVDAWIHCFILGSSLRHFHTSCANLGIQSGFCNSLNSCFVMSWAVERQASVTYLDGKANLLPCSSTAESSTATYALSLSPDVVRSPWDCPKLCQGPGLLPALLSSPAPDSIWIWTAIGTRQPTFPKQVQSFRASLKKTHRWVYEVLKVWKQLNIKVLCKLRSGQLTDAKCVPIYSHAEVLLWTRNPSTP